MKDVHVFSEPAELGELSALPFFRSRGRGRIRLSGRLAENENSAEWERDLNRYYFACGCDTGAKGTLIGIVGAALLTFDSLRRGWFGWTSLILLWVVLILSASGIGKLVGLIRADRRLKQLINRIRHEVPPEPRVPNAPVLLCG
jgi:hypothetical protein